MGNQYNAFYVTMATRFPFRLWTSGGGVIDRLAKWAINITTAAAAATAAEANAASNGGDLVGGDDVAPSEKDVLFSG